MHSNVHRHLVAIDAAAEYLAVSTKTIRRRIADGTITGYRVGSRLLRVDIDELESIIRPVPAAERGAAR